MRPGRVLVKVAECPPPIEPGKVPGKVPGSVPGKEDGPEGTTWGMGPELWRGRPLLPRWSQGGTPHQPFLTGEAGGG